jgi:hypothetical protein
MGLRVQLKTTDRINSGFAEHDLLRACIADPEVACVSAGAGRKATPDSRTGATQLGADRTVRFPCHHDEYRVAAAVRVQLAVVDQ